MSERHLRPEPGASALPQPAVEASAPQEKGNPWEQRYELGWRAALWRTCKLFLFSPKKGYESTLGRGGFRGPLLFALIVCFVASFVAELFDALYQLAIDPEGSGNLGDILDVSLEGETLGGIEWLPASLLGAVSFAGCVFGLLFGIPVFAVMFPLVMLVWTGILHLCLKLAGGLRDSEAGYQGTWAAVCYASVGFLPGVVPLIGDWVTFLWLGLLQGIGFWIVHRTTRTRAAVALMLPFSVPIVLWLLKTLGVFPIETGGGP